MENLSNTIECPNCGQLIDVNELLYNKLDDELKKKYNAQIAEEKKKFEKEYDSLKADRTELETEKKKLKDAIDSGIKEGLETERLRLEKEIKQKVEEEQSERINSLEKELNQKSKQLKQLNKAKSEIERLKREKDELKDSIEAESEKKFSEMLKKERERIKKSEEEKTQLKISERNQVIEQLKSQLKEAQRKAEQGSMQLQGEVQELAIEDWLDNNFPLDTIQEIKKGARGADCLQIINTTTTQNCGTIYYESKRTKAFSAGWIEKFKNDIRDRGANIGVLVTEAMPRDMNRMGQKDGIWICSFDEFKGLSAVLRDSIIKLSAALATQEYKGDKMSMLYDYLTSNEFRLQIEAIVEGFTQMQTDLDSEKRSMNGIWKKREKQIEKVLLNTTYMYNSIKGIAGSAIQPVKLLELPNGDGVDDDIV